MARAAEILQIQPLLKRKPAELSGGQRQRVAIGRALVRDVDVFLFDEPLSNLDAKLRSELRVEIKRLHQSLKNTMIYVTHDQIEALTLADRIAIMKSGIIQQLADPHDHLQQAEEPLRGRLHRLAVDELPARRTRRSRATTRSFTANGVNFALDAYDGYRYAAARPQGRARCPPRTYQGQRDYRRGSA